MTVQADPDDQDVPIELGPVETSPATFLPRPHPDAQSARLVGRAPGDSPAVYLNVRAVEAMFTDVSAHGDNETGGILSGDQYVDSRGAYVRVEGAIPARDAMRSATRVTFTHRGWNTMLAERRSRFPDQSVIGWYHSHPGMSVLLSDADRFVHGAFFSRPQDVAAVIDLHRREWALFGWENGEITLLAGFWIYADAEEDGVGLGPILDRFSPRL